MSLTHDRVPFSYAPFPTQDIFSGMQRRICSRQHRWFPIWGYTLTNHRDRDPPPGPGIDQRVISVWRQPWDHFLRDLALWCSSVSHQLARAESKARRKKGKAPATQNVFIGMIQTASLKIILNVQDCYFVKTRNLFQILTVVVLAAATFWYIEKPEQKAENSLDLSLVAIILSNG